MADINHVVLVARLTKDIEVSYSKNSNTPIGNISVASNRRKKQGDQWVDEVSFFDVTIIGKTADSLKQYLTKGKQIGIEGSLHQDRWEKDGKKFSKIVIIAENIQLLGGDKGSSESSHGGDASRDSSQPEGAHGQTTNGFNEDIPYDDTPAF